MKRMTQILMSCLLAVVILMGSMANAMAARVGQTFTLNPNGHEFLNFNPGESSFTAAFSLQSPAPAIVIVDGETCNDVVTINPNPNRPTMKQFNCGNFAFFINTSDSPVQISTK